MMETPFRISVLAATGVLVMASGCAPSSGPEPDDTAAGVESSDWTPPPLTDAESDLPDPVAVVRRTAEFMRSQPELLMEAMVTFGAPQESGQMLHFDVLERLAVRRPDKLAWVTLNDDGTVDRGWLSDGEFTLLKQPLNMWGSVSVPSAIPEAVDRLVGEYDMDVPFEDLLAVDPAERWVGEGATSVEYIGEEWVHGSWTDHVAMRKPGFDLEMWIRRGAEPFPAKIMVVLTAEEGMPSYVARFRRWSTTLPDGDATFEFTPPADAQRVDVAPVVQP